MTLASCYSDAIKPSTCLAVALVSLHIEAMTHSMKKTRKESEFQFKILLFRKQSVLLQCGDNVTVTVDVIWLFIDPDQSPSASSSIENHLIDFFPFF